MCFIVEKARQQTVSPAPRPLFPRVAFFSGRCYTVVCTELLRAAGLQIRTERYKSVKKKLCIVLVLSLLLLLLSACGKSEEMKQFEALFNAFKENDGWDEVDAITDYFDADSAPEEVMDRLMELAEDGDPYAQYLAGYCYSYGSNIEQDDQQAFRWASLSHEQGNSYGTNLLACCYSEGMGTERNDKVAFALFKKAAEDGNPVAQYNLGRAYARGAGVEIDEEEALLWIKKAADQGFTYSQYSAAYYYYNGIGCDVDYGAAFKYFSRAADDDYAPAQYMLGLMYERGQGTDADHAKALKLWKEAARHGDTDAILALSDLGESW